MDLQVTPDERLLIENFMGQPFYFSKDWNGLMPVVEKIEKLGADFEIRTTGVHLEFDTEGEPFVILTQGEDGDQDKLSNTYKSIVSFIKWHNSQAK